MKSRRVAAAAVITLASLVAGCGGGGGGSGSGGCSGSCTTATSALTVADVQHVIAQAVTEAQANNVKATIAVVDRVGNVLGVFQMNGAVATVTITSNSGATGGLEGIAVPSELAALSKAITGAYLSSEGNAFSTRTAGQIIQQNFDPGEENQPSGPLSGVQFSQLSCSDVSQRASAGTVGPKRAPLGLAADPGGLPLYKNGTVVGGIGVVADGTYGLDRVITDTDADVDELIAVAGGAGLAAPADRRANEITVDGRTLRYVDSEAIKSTPATAPPFASVNGIVGALINVTGYGGSPIVAGVAFGTPASGYRADASLAFAGTGAYILVDSANAPRYPPVAGSDGLLTQNEVTQTLKSGLAVAARARAQIRRPLGSAAQVSVVVVDTKGVVLGLVRSQDAPVFGTDVAVQKARTAAFFSSVTAAAQLQALPPANYPTPPASSSIAAYVTATRAFLAAPTALANGIAYSNRAIANLARPYFPDGIAGTANGSLAKPVPPWSVFNDGLQLDLVNNNLVAGVLGDPVVGCTGDATLPNGIQIFPGGFPIYRGQQLVGAVGVSGDGVDQDDMVAFLGLANAGTALGNAIGNAPAGRRADNIVPAGTGTRLRYVNCPQSPFNDSTEQNVCAGF